MQDLVALGRYLEALESPEFSAGKWAGGQETSPAVMHMHYVSYSDWTHAFLEFVYDDGWIMQDFDWPKWIATKEARTLGAGGEAVAKATRRQLAKILTAIVRQDRF